MTPADHLSLIHKFYEAFSRRDWETMATCYHKDVTFSDPVFINLKGIEVSMMWRMLCERAQSFHLTHQNASTEEHIGSCDWEAKYLFSKTGRNVHNKITASFEFKEGKIFRHVDTFDFWKWSQMALGPAGLLLGWSSFLKNKVIQKANTDLQRYIQKVSQQA